MKKLVYVGAVCALSTVVLAQSRDPRDIALTAARPVANAHTTQLGDGAALTPVDIYIDTIGQGHVRYAQSYRGIPVFEGDLVVHVDLASGVVLSETDALQSFGPIATRATLAPETAREHGRRHFGLRAGRHEERADLLLLVDQHVAALAYRTRFRGDDAKAGPVDRVAFVDAQGRGVLRAWDAVETAASSGTGKGYFSGTVPLTTNSLASGFEMRDPSRGSQYTINMNNGTASGSLYTDADNTWGDSTLANVQTVGVDAQYGTAKTWDYYKLVHNRNGIANDGRGAYNRVHYGYKYNNAFWSDACFCMTYGDGDGVNFNPFDSLDVAGHEMTHGITSRTARLTYSGESGGLNEATSDIFGTMVEYYTNNPLDVPDYYIGERLFKVSGYALRTMIQPSQDGVSSDCWYSGVGNLDVHYSSGVANHFFYLLAQGTSKGIPSKTCVAGNTRVASGFGTVTGIGRSAAERIWYRALTVYMTSSTTFAGARTATLNAAKDLYGTTSAQYAAVAAAWTAVGRP